MKHINVSKQDLARDYHVFEMSQHEIAAKYGCSQTWIHVLMDEFRIPKRTQGKRNQLGIKNHRWTGDNASYNAGHRRVRRARGTPSKCESCGTKTAVKFQWASISGNYGNVNDYIRLCGSCHNTMDGIAYNIRKMRIYGSNRKHIRS